jgi:transposase
MARRYTDAFKSEAVRQVEQGKDITEVARRLGVSRVQLYRWLEQAKPAEPKKGRAESELARLKRENAELKEENSFLKKAAAYFAKERPRGTR